MMTEFTYEVLDYGINKMILRSDGAFIPFEEANSDYQRYLRWLNGEDEDGTLS